MTGPRATLEQLEARWGYQATEKDANGVRVWLVTMDKKRECWVRVSGSGRSALFECVESPEGEETCDGKTSGT